MNEQRTREWLGVARLCEAHAAALAGGSLLLSFVRIARIRRYAPAALHLAADILFEVVHAIDVRGADPEELRHLIHHHRYDGSISARIPSMQRLRTPSVPHPLPGSSTPEKRPPP